MEGMEEERGKVTGNGRDGTGHGMGRVGKGMEWNGGRGGKGRRGATAPKLQFLAPPLVMANLARMCGNQL